MRGWCKVGMSDNKNVSSSVLYSTLFFFFFFFLIMVLRDESQGNHAPGIMNRP